MMEIPARLTPAMPVFAFSRPIPIALIRARASPAMMEIHARLIHALTAIVCLPQLFATMAMRVRLIHAFPDYVPFHR